jgi:hypothetical protein
VTDEDKPHSECVKEMQEIARSRYRYDRAICRHGACYRLVETRKSKNRNNLNDDPTYKYVRYYPGEPKGAKR